LLRRPRFRRELGCHSPRRFGSLDRCAARWNDEESRGKQRDAEMLERTLSVLRIRTARLVVVLVLLLGGPIAGMLVVIGVDLTRVVMTVFTRAKLSVLGSRVGVRAPSQRVRHRTCQSVRMVFPVTDGVRQRKNDRQRSE
jgi:hypothetical protein